MYPLGGAADRLHLVDEETGNELPAAKLNYGGKTLFSGLIQDLQAREYLYYKLYGKQVEVPIAIMTSEDKDNYRHVWNICEECQLVRASQRAFPSLYAASRACSGPKGDWVLLGPFTLY